MVFHYDSSDPLAVVTAPPPNESPEGKAAREEHEAEVQRISDQIDDELHAERANALETGAATTEALQTLWQIYSTPSASQTQLNANQNAHNNDDDGWSNLDSEGTTPREAPSRHVDGPNETASRAHKNLQQDFENKLVEGSQYFLKVREVDQKLDDLQHIVAEIRQHCGEAEMQLKLTEEASLSLLEQAESLRYGTR
ncbi:hypothetical protein EV363DRAFT_1241812, partial [Boletus edulis]